MRYIIAILLFFQSCTSSDSDPASTLREYINYRFSKNQSKAKILEKTTGELYRDLNRFSEEALNNLVNSEKYRRGSLKINLKKCDPNRCYITYTLKAIKKKNGQQDFQVEVKKIAHLERENEVWKISKINEIKSYFGTEKPIDVKTPGKIHNPFK